MTAFCLCLVYMINQYSLFQTICSSGKSDKIKKRYRSSHPGTNLTEETIILFLNLWHARAIFLLLTRVLGSVTLKTSVQEMP